MAKIFISYTRVDAPFVQRLKGALSDQGHDVWVDMNGIPPGEVFLRKIREAIEESDAFVSVLTPELTRSEVCRLETEHAITHHKRILPVVLREVNRREVPKALAERNWIFFQEGDDFDSSNAALLAAVAVNLEWVQAHTRMTVRATEWERKSRDRSYLLRGTDLTDAEQSLVRAGAGGEPRATALMQDYVLASRADATRRQRLTLRSVGYGLLLTTALAAYAGWKGWVALQAQKTTEEANKVEVATRKIAVDFQKKAVEEARLARRAKAAQIVERSKAALEKSPQLATLLAVEAVRTSQGPEPREPHLIAAEAALRGALASFGGRPLSGHSTLISDAKISPDGRWLLMCDEEGFARLWDLAASPPPKTPLSISTKPPGFPENRVCPATGVFSPASRRLALSLIDGSILVVALPGPGANGSAPTARRIQVGLEGGCQVVGFDGRRLVLYDPGERFLTPVARGPAAQKRQFQDSNQRVYDHWLRLADLGVTEDAVAAPEPRVVVLNGPEGRLAAPSDQLGLVAVSPDQRTVALADGNGQVRVWNLDAAEPAKGVVLLPGHAGAVTALALARGGRRVAAAPAGKPVLVWERHADGSFAEPNPLSDTSGVEDFGLALDPRGNWVAVLRVAGGGRIWNLHDGRPPEVLTGGVGAGVFKLVAPSEGGRLFAFDADRRVVNVKSIHDWIEGEFEMTLPAGHGEQDWVSSPFSPVVCPSGRWLVTSVRNSQAATRVWDLQAGCAAEPTLIGVESWRPFRQSGGRWLVSENRDGRLELRDRATPESLKLAVELRLPKSAIPLVSGLSLNTTWNSFDVDRTGRWVLGNNKDWAFLWDLHSTDGRDKALVIEARDDAIWGVTTLAREGTRLLLQRFLKGKIEWRLWNLNGTAPVEAPPTTSPMHLNQTRLSPDGRWLVGLPDRNGDGVPRLWACSEPGGVAALIALTGHSAKVSKFDFSADGRCLATGDEVGSVRLWDIRTPGGLSSRLLRPPGKDLNGLSQLEFSPDSRWLAVKDQSTFATLHAISAPDPSASTVTLEVPWLLNARASFSPDSTRVLVPGPASTVIFDLTAKDPAARPRTLRGVAGSGAVSDDARWLASVNGTSLLLWDLSALGGSEPVEIATSHVNISHVGAFLGFTGDGRAVVVAGNTSAFVTFRTNLDDLIRAAEYSLSGNLTFDEGRATYAGRPYEKTFPSLP
jgi:WD40 repeat protein